MTHTQPQFYSHYRVHVIPCGHGTFSWVGGPTYINHNNKPLLGRPHNVKDMKPMEGHSPAENEKVAVDMFISVVQLYC